MTTLLLGRAKLIGRVRYYLLDRYYSLTIRVLFITMGLTGTVISTILLRHGYISDPLYQLRGFLPAILLIGFFTLNYVHSNIQLPVIGILLVSMLIGDGIDTGSGTKITFTFIFLHLWLLVWLVKMLVVDRKIKVRASPANKPALLFILAVVISFLWAWGYVDQNVGPLYSSKFFARLMTALVLIISPATYFLYSNHIRSMRTLRYMVWCFITIGGVFAVLLALSILDAPLNAGGQFPTWVCAFCVGQLLFNTKLKWYLRIVLAIIVLWWAYRTLGLGITWLSGWLPLSLVCLILLFLHSRKLFIVAVVVVLAYILLNTVSVEETFNREEGESGGTRTAAWEAALDLTKDHLLFGTGPAGYAFYYSTNGFKANFSHNNYVDIVTQLGLVGFSVFILFWIAQGRVVWKMYRTVQGDGFFKGLKASLVACYFAIWVSMMLGDWVTPFTYTQTLAGFDYTIWAWMISGMAVALYHIHQETEHQKIGAVLADRY